MLGPVLAFQAAIAASSYAIATRLNGGPVVRAALLLSLAGVLLFAAPAFVSVCQSVLAVQALTCVYFTSAMKLAALAMNRGCLAKELSAGASFWRYCGVLAFPVVPTNTGQPAPKNAPALVGAKLQRAFLTLGFFALVTMMGMVALSLPSASDANKSTKPTWDWPQNSAALLLVQPLLVYLSGVALWLEVDGVGHLMDALALGLFGIEAEPHFRAPFLSPSINEYWGKRWNLTVSSILRQLVFFPICDGSFYPKNDRTKSLGSKTPSTDLLTTPTTTTTTTSQDLAPAPAPLPDSDSSTGHSEPTTNTHDNKPYYKAGDLSRDSGVSVASSQAISEAPSMAGSVATSASGAARKRQGASTGRRCLGSLCTFIVSGLWHELVFAQMTGGHTTRGVWTAFFVIQAPLITLETAIHAWMNKRKLHVPRWVSILTVNVLIATQVMVFWVPPMLWKLPSSCPTGPPSLSLLEAIQMQGTRDLNGMTRLVTAATSVLTSNTLVTGSGLENVVSWVRDTASQWAA